MIEKFEYVCNSEIPASLRDQCNTFITNYGSNIIDLILDDIDADVICRELGLCPSLIKSKPTNKLANTDLFKYVKQVKPMYHLEPALKVNEKKNDDTLECTLCVYVAQLADNFLKKNKTEEEIENELRLVCNFFPTKLNAEVTILLRN